MTSIIAFTKNGPSFPRRIFQESQQSPRRARKTNSGSNNDEKQPAERTEKNVE